VRAEAPRSLGAFYCPTGVGRRWPRAQETRTIDGRESLLRYPIRRVTSRWSRPRSPTRWQPHPPSDTARNFGPVMATRRASKYVQVDRASRTDGIDQETVGQSRESTVETRSRMCAGVADRETTG